MSKKKPKKQISPNDLKVSTPIQYPPGFDIKLEFRIKIPVEQIISALTVLDNEAKQRIDDEKLYYPAGYISSWEIYRNALLQLSRKIGIDWNPEA